MYRICALIIATMVTFPAAAKTLTCGQLKDRLENPVGRPYFDTGSQLLAVAATHPELCIPPGTILGVLQAVFIHWADKNAKLMGMDSWECTARAFQESFPCARPIPKSDRSN